MISSFRLYSGRREIVPGGTETVGGEDVTEIGEAAVERGPAAKTLGRERGQGAMRQRRAEPAILGREPRERSLQGEVKFGDGGSAAGLAVPGGKPVVLGQRVADRLAGAGQRHLEREQRSTLRTALAVMTHRDPRGLVAQHDVGEGADATARGIVGGQAAQQIDQEILAQILALADRQAQLAPQPLCRRIGRANDDFNVGGVEFDLHRCAPRSSFLMSPRCRMRSARRWERGGNEVGVWWAWPFARGDELGASLNPCAYCRAGFAFSLPRVVINGVEQCSPTLPKLSIASFGLVDVVPLRCADHFHDSVPVIFEVKSRLGEAHPIRRGHNIGIGDA